MTIGVGTLTADRPAAAGTEPAAGAAAGGFSTRWLGVLGKREKPWEGYAAVASSSGGGGEWVNPGCPAVEVACEVAVEHSGAALKE